jgi:protein TonB
METRIIGGSWDSPSSAARNVIVFENRNKSYGAYHLRSKYTDFVSIAALIGISCFVLSVSGPKIYDLLMGNSLVVKVPKNEIHNKSTMLDPPPPPIDKVLTQLPDVKAQNVKQIKFTSPVVTDNEDVFQEIPTMREMQNVNIGIQHIEGSYGTDYDPITIIENTITEESQSAPIKFVDIMPEFPGGEEELLKYVNNNIIYPTIARENGITGRVVLTFIVSVDGTISNISVLRDIGGGCAEEAIRVVKKMPKWSAGRHNGRPVNVEFNLPINFELR